MGISKADARTFFESLTRGEYFWAQRCDGYIEYCQYDKFTPVGVDSGIVQYGVYIFPIDQDFQFTVFNLDSLDADPNPYDDFVKDITTIVYEGDCSMGGGGTVPDNVLTSAFAFKDPARVATTANLDALASGTGVGKTLTNNGALAALEIDGVTVAVGDRILVKDQTNAADNGIYTVTVAGDGSTAWVLTRSEDADEDSEVPGNTFLFAQEGTANGDTAFTLVNITGDAVVDTDDLDFVTYPNASISVIGGDGIDVVGSTVSVDSTVLRTTNINDAIITTTDLWSSQKISQEISAVDRELQTEVVLITAGMDTQGYFDLDNEPLDPSTVMMWHCGGSVQINGLSLTAKSGAATPNFEMDSISPTRLYFKNVAASGGAVPGTDNAAHSGLDELFEGLTVVVQYHI